MKRKIFNFLILGLFLFAFEALNAAEPEFEFVLKPESRLWLKGDSTMHKFEAEAHEIKITGLTGVKKDIPASAGLLEDIIAMPDLKEFLLIVPVEQLKSDTAGLTGRMHKALKKEDSPQIMFNIKRYSSEKSTSQKNTYMVNSTGTLLIANVENLIPLKTLAVATTGYINIKGKKELLMTDYGIKPPSILGLLKTKDKVTVQWDIKMGIEKKDDGNSEDKKKIMDEKSSDEETEGGN